jgi:hypothetical protein
MMTRRGPLVAIAIASLISASCAPTGGGGTPRVELESKAGGLQVDLVASPGAGKGEVCATLTVHLAGAADSVDEECGSTASPTPLVGGYSVADLNLEGYTYSWGALRSDVHGIVPSEGVAVDYDTLPLKGYSDCCVLYLSVVQGSEATRALANLQLVNSEGGTVGMLPLRSPGAQ